MEGNRAGTSPRHGRYAAPCWTSVLLAWPALMMLCPDLPASGQVYLTREQALQRAFPGVKSFMEMRHRLSKKERKALEKRLRRKLAEPGYIAYLALDQHGTATGFALVTAEIGKTEPFFLLIAMSLQGELLDIELLEYRESRGAAIRGRRYLNRFRKINIANFRKKMRGIPVIPGATLSCNAVARAVKKALYVQRSYVEEGKGKGLAQRLMHRFKRGGARKIEIQRDPSQGRSQPSERTGYRSSLSLPAMGDLVKIEVEESLPQLELQSILAVVKDLEARLSPKRKDSLIGRANALAVGEALDLSTWADLVPPLQLAFAAARQSGGCFSPVPELADPRQAFRFENNSTLLRRVGLGRLDPGGFAKGLAADRLVAELERRGISWSFAGFRSSFCIEMDGQVLAVATSGDSMRGAHIVDPRTGRRPKRNAQYTVLAATGLEAECYSTACYIADAQA